MELIDIFDINQVYIGTEDRNVAHKHGLWHKAFHCWIISVIEGTPCLIFQLRSTSRSFPGFLDISVAGHFGAGEDDKDLVREIEEELGLFVNYNSLHYLGQRTEILDYGEIRNREFQKVYIVQLEDLLKSLKPDAEEVAGVYWLPVKKGLELFSVSKKNASIQGLVFNKTNNLWEPASMAISRANFIPRKDNYFLLISIMAQRFIDRDFPVAI